MPWSWAAKQVTELSTFQKELARSERRLTSQSVQDGVLNGIFRQLGTTNRRYVEFGFNSNAMEEGTGANAYNLWRHGWTGLLMDGGHGNASINLHRELISPYNIHHLFEKYKVPEKFDYLSIDFDSYDLWVFHAILAAGRWQPRVVTVEYNAAFPSGSTLSLEMPETGAYWPQEECIFGASLGALELVGRRYGYTLVYVIPGLDAVFVRNDVLATAQPPVQITPVLDAVPHELLFDGYIETSKEQSHFFVPHHRRSDRKPEWRMPTIGGNFTSHLGFWSRRCPQVTSLRFQALEDVAVFIETNDHAVAKSAAASSSFVLAPPRVASGAKVTNVAPSAALIGNSLHSTPCAASVHRTSKIPIASMIILTALSNDTHSVGLCHTRVASRLWPWPCQHQSMLSRKTDCKMRAQTTLHTLFQNWLAFIPVDLRSAIVVLAHDNASAALAAGHGLVVESPPTCCRLHDGRTLCAQERLRRGWGYRILAIAYYLKRGRSVLVSDIDTIWLQDPRPFLRLSADIIAARGSTSWHDINCGFALYRPGFLHAIPDWLKEWDNTPWGDQFSLNKAIGERALWVDSGSSGESFGTVLLKEGKVSMRLLPSHLFPQMSHALLGNDECERHRNRPITNQSDREYNLFCLDEQVVALHNKAELFRGMELVAIGAQGNSYVPADLQATGKRLWRNVAATCPEQIHKRQPSSHHVQKAHQGRL